jgi:hypothetical protein
MVSCGLLAFCLLALLLTGVLIVSCYVWQTRLPITSLVLVPSALPSPSKDPLVLTGTLKLSIENLNGQFADIAVHATMGSIGKSDVVQMHLPPKGGMVDTLLPVRLMYTPTTDPQSRQLKDMLMVCKQHNTTQTIQTRWKITLTMRLFRRMIRFTSTKLQRVPLVCLLPGGAENRITA